MMDSQFPDDPRDLMDRLDEILPPHSREIHSGDVDPLVGAARRLAQGPDITLSDAALDRLEARLRARTVELHSSAQTQSALSRRIARRGLWIGPLWRYAAAALLILVLVAFGAGRASASSLPGDALYPVKRAVEDVRLALVSDNGEPGLRVDLAERRIAEFNKLLARGTIYPHALEEASDQFNRALDLLASGYGSRAVLDQRIFSLVQTEEMLLEQAVTISGQGENPRLQAIADQATAIQGRLLSEGSVPSVIPVPTETPTPVVTALATTDAPILAASPLPTNTSTPALTATMTPTFTPAVSETPTPSPTPRPDNLLDEADLTPSRTPPGHGPTPGLGGNPPGHGGDHPGQGNNGQPPGQNKQKVDKGKGKSKP